MLTDKTQETDSRAQSALIPDGGTRDLGRRTVRGGAVVFASLALQKAAQLGILAILARLLTPKDYGLLGMVFALTAFLEVFADLGLSQATVQKATLTRGQVSTLFWVNLAFGVVLTIVAAGAAPIAAWFYAVPQLLPVTLWISLGFAVGALGTQHSALMLRRMQFGRLAACDLLSTMTGGGVGIWMALGGWGVYALVAQQLAQTAARTVCVWLLAGWAPGLPVRGSGVRPMLGFGGYLAGFKIVNYFARNLDKVLLGRFCGAAPLGLYTRAYSLMALPVSFVSDPTGRVMIPALSKLQGDPARLRQAYLRGLEIIALLAFPIMTGLLVTADEAVAVVFGPRWADAVPIFRILCIAGMWQGIYSATGQVYVAAGRTDRMLRAGLAGSAVLAAAFAVGVSGGPQGVALAYAIGLSAVLLPYLAYTYATVGLSLKTVVGRVLPHLAASLAIIPVVALLKLRLPADWPAIGRLGACAAAGAGAFLLALSLIRPAVLGQTATYIMGLLPFGRRPEIERAKR